MSAGARARTGLAALLVVLLPLAWTAPLLRAGLLPLFGTREISVLSGLEALWQSDRVLAAIVALFALVAPAAKLAAIIAAETGHGTARLIALAALLGRLAMADIFLIAIYVTVAKGMGIGRVETAWGLYIFTAVVLASLALTHSTDRRAR